MLVKKSKLIKLIKEEAEKAKNNPWAICTAQVGRSDKEKYEKCVLSVKKSLKEEDIGTDTQETDTEIERIVSDNIELIVDEIMHIWFELGTLEDKNVWKQKVIKAADELSKDLERTIRDQILKKILHYKTKLQA